MINRKMRLIPVAILLVLLLGLATVFYNQPTQPDEILVEPSASEEPRSVLPQNVTAEVNNIITMLNAPSDSSELSLFESMEQGVVTNPNEYENLIEVWGNLTLAIDMGHDIEALNGFGILPHESGGYEVNVNRYQGWRLLHDQLYRLRSDRNRIERTLEELRVAGLSQQNLENIRSYIAANSVEGGIRQAELEFNENVAILKSRQLTPEELNSTTRRLYLEFFSKTNELLKNWSLGLWNSLDSEGKVIVQRTLQRTQSNMIIYPQQLN